jgi:hypothetical protein
MEKFEKIFISKLNEFKSSDEYKKNFPSLIFYMGTISNILQDYYSVFINFIILFCIITVFSFFIFFFKNLIFFVYEDFEFNEKKNFFFNFLFFIWSFLKFFFNFFVFIIINIFSLLTPIIILCEIFGYEIFYLIFFFFIWYVLLINFYSFQQIIFQQSFKKFKKNKFNFFKLNYFKLFLINFFFIFLCLILFLNLNEFIYYCSLQYLISFTIYNINFYFYNELIIFIFQTYLNLFKKKELNNLIEKKYEIIISKNIKILEITEKKIKEENKTNLEKKNQINNDIYLENFNFKIILSKLKIFFFKKAKIIKILKFPIIIILIILIIIFIIFYSLQQNPEILIKQLVPEKKESTNYLNNILTYNKGLPNILIFNIKNKDKKIDFTNPQIQNFFKLLDENLKENFGSNSLIVNWFSFFITWIVFMSTHSQEYNDNDKIIPKNLFYNWLDEFTKSSYGSLLNSFFTIKFDNKLNSSYVYSSSVISLLRNIPVNSTKG